MPKKDPFGDLSPDARQELGDRIRVLVESVGTQAEAAAIAGVSIQQLGRFMRAVNAPSLLPLARLSEASGISLDWVTRGKGSREREPTRDATPPSSSDPDLLGRVVDAIVRVYQEEGIKLPPVDLGRIAAAEYDIIAAAALDPREYRPLIRAMAERLRRRLGEGMRKRRRGA